MATATTIKPPTPAPEEAGGPSKVAVYNYRSREASLTSDASQLEEASNDEWGLREVEISELNSPSTFKSQAITVIFANDTDTFKATYKSQEDGIREIVLGDLNGSFFCDYEYKTNDDDDIDDELIGHTSWATYKGKWVDEHKYFWIQATMVIKWFIKEERIEILFIGLTKEQREYIVRLLPKQRRLQLHPFAWHALFAQSMIDLYNVSIWGLRNLVRPLEQKRKLSSDIAGQLGRRHDIARHLLHCTEILEVAENTLTNLAKEHKRFREDYPDLAKKGVAVNTQQKLYFLEKEIHSLRMRSRSLTERLKNEVNLGFNLAAFSESAVMKAIGIVTMLYLPGTFVSGIFGTNFFDFNAPSEDTWTTSSKFWLYWAITIPLTILTFVLWVLWRYAPKLIDGWREFFDDRNYKKRQEAKENERKEKGMEDQEVRERIQRYETQPADMV